LLKKDKLIRTLLIKAAGGCLECLLEESVIVNRASLANAVLEVEK